MILFTLVYILAALALIVHYFALPRQKRVKAKVFELALLYLIVFVLGFSSFLAFWGLTFYGNDSPDSLGPSLCSFSQELASINLAYALLGVISIWLRKLFWMATVIGYSAWILIDGIQDICLYFVTPAAEMSSYDISLILNLLDPIVLLVFLFFYLKTQPKSIF